MPAHARKDKLVPRGRNAIFVGYVDETTKQWKFWAPDLQRVIVVKRAEFFEDKKGGEFQLNLDLKLSSGRTITGNGTPNVMPKRNPRSRPVNYPAVPRLVKRKHFSVEHLTQNPDLLCTVAEDNLAISRSPEHNLSTDTDSITKTDILIQDSETELQDPKMKQSRTENISSTVCTATHPINEAENIIKSPKKKGKVERLSKKTKSSKKKSVKPLSKEPEIPIALPETTINEISNEKVYFLTNDKSQIKPREMKEAPSLIPKSDSAIESNPHAKINHRITRSKTLAMEKSRHEALRSSFLSNLKKIEEEDLTVGNTTLPNDFSPPQTQTQKRKRPNNDDGGDNTPDPKILRAMLAMLEQLHDRSTIQEDCSLTEDLVSIAFHSIQTPVNSKIPIPTTYEQAIQDPEYGALWKKAIEEELNSLISNGTWKEEVAPSGINLVGTKWVFTVKYNADGTFELFKARLVARGFTQQYGVDYTETFAPTVQMATMRAFLSIVAAEDLHCWQFDIKNTFTESIMKEVVYLRPPKGVKVTKGMSLRVLRSLYGLKQSARDWNKLLQSEMVKWGFIQSLADPCLFTHKSRGLIGLVYVDDIAIAGKSTANLNWFNKTLSNRFNTKNLGGILKILGMRITRNRQTRTLFIDQEQYLEKILRKFGFPNPTHKTQRIHMDGYDSLRPATETDVRVDPKEYAMIIGSIMFAMVYTQPYIAFTLGRLS